MKEHEKWKKWAITDLKSGLQPLGRYGTHQETISSRPELTVY